MEKRKVINEEGFQNNRKFSSNSEAIVSWFESLWHEVQTTRHTMLYSARIRNPFPFGLCSLFYIIVSLALLPAFVQPSRAAARKL